VPRVATISARFSARSATPGEPKLRCICATPGDTLSRNLSAGFLTARRRFELLVVDSRRIGFLRHSAAARLEKGPNSNRANNGLCIRIGRSRAFASL
jgi:hypothetical protein